MTLTLFAAIIATIAAIIFIALIFSSSESFSQVEDRLATSKIGSVAMGLVEISGKVKPIEPLVSPFTKTRCVAYLHTVSRWDVKRRKSRNKISEESKVQRFKLEDDTGSVIIDSQQLAAYGVPFVHRNVDKKPDFEFTHKEYLLRENDEVMVIGRAESIDGETIIKHDPETNVFEVRVLTTVHVDRKDRPLMKSLGYILLSLIIITAIMLVL